jgi:hypothetical protein
LGHDVLVVHAFELGVGDDVVLLAFDLSCCHL